MSDEAKVRELLAPMRDISVDLDGRRFKVDRSKVVAAIVAAPAVLGARRPAPSRRVVWALAAGFALAAGAVGWLAANRSGHTVVADRMLDIRGIRGEVMHVEGGAKSAVGPGAISPVGELVTAAASEAYFRTPDGLEVQAFENSSMGLSDLRASQEGLSLRLDSGAVRCHVPHLAQGRRFSVITPDATVVVHGTTFRVTVGASKGSPKTCVRVEEGVVSVNGKAGQARLEGSQSWGCDEPTADVEDAPVEPGTAGSRSERKAPSRATGDPARGDSPRPDRGTLDEENRLFQGGLAAERAGDSRGATASFELLLSRYPRSPLANEARAALSRVAPGATTLGNTRRGESAP